MQLAFFAELLPHLAWWTARASALFVVAVIVVSLLQHRSAALRHAVLTAAVLCSLAIPFVSAFGVRAVIPTFVLQYPRTIVEWFSAEPAENAGTLTTAAPSRSGRSIHVDIPAAESVGRKRGASALGVLALVWLVGAAYLLGRRASASIAAARLKKCARPVHEAEFLALVRRVAAAQRITRIPELRVSHSLSTPATLGCLRPVVLLPASIVEWPRERLHAILAHELAHIARHDCITSLLGDLAKALHWCNPLVWLVTRRMILERERSCDDRALAAGVEPMQYAMLLFDVARAANSGRTPASVLTMARPRELESRLLAIVRGESIQRDPLSRRAMTVIAGATVLLGTIVSGRAAASQPSVAESNLEPDRRGDSLAHPSTERLPLNINGDSLARAVRASALWQGPDSMLVRQLVERGLTRESSDPAELVRDRSLWALTRGRGGSLLTPIRESLGDSDWRVQAYASWTLGVAQDRVAVPALVQLLEHPVWRLRAMAAWSLYFIGDAAALTALVRALDDEAWQVRSAAVYFVGAHGDSAVVARMVSARLNDRHVAVRNAAREALTELRSSPR